MSAAAMREPEDDTPRQADSPGRLMAIEALLQQIARSMQKQDERADRDYAQLRHDMEAMEARQQKQLEAINQRLARQENDNAAGLNKAMDVAAQNRQQINFWRGALAAAAVFWTCVLSLGSLIFGGLIKKLWE